MADLAVVVTFDPDSESFARLELEEFFPQAVIERPAGGSAPDGAILLVRGPFSFSGFSREIARRGSIFIRHIAPVQQEISLTGDRSDIETLVAAATRMASAIDPGKTFAVQTRLFTEGEEPYRRVEVNEALSTAIANATGATLDTRNPEQVVSVLILGGVARLGVSRTAQNLSDWAGGNHRFKNEPERISRSEFKLLEAISVFGLKLPTHGNALDMGASPGGWTRVLREYGLSVVAVDPADLNARLKGDTGVQHVRLQIQAYLNRAPRFRVVVNDLKMDAADSVQVMLNAASRLESGGLAVMTIKLSRKTGQPPEALQLVRESLQRLSASYVVLGARQLYHNRSEVTVALRRK
jgi:23S rRNA (cytidine2498-2'-O)-methyltransferase